MSDSEPDVNPWTSIGFRIVTPAARKLAHVPGNRDDIVSGYVRKRIRDWQAEGRELQELARIAGFAKSTPSQVLLGTGVGMKTGPRWAKALGFGSFDDLRLAAFEWWKAEGQAGQELVAFPKTDEMSQAIEAILLLEQGSREQLETILAAFAHPRFRWRTKDWWIQTLLAELAADRQSVHADAATREKIAAHHKEMRALRERQKNAPVPSRRRD